LTVIELTAAIVVKACPVDEPEHAFCGDAAVAQDVKVSRQRELSAGQSVRSQGVFGNERIAAIRLSRIEGAHRGKNIREPQGWLQRRM